jgi:hypothetical protein
LENVSVGHGVSSPSRCSVASRVCVAAGDGRS